MEDRCKKLEAELRRKMIHYQTQDRDLAEIEGQLGSFAIYGIKNNGSIESFAKLLDLDEFRKLLSQFEQVHSCYRQMYCTLLEIRERVGIARTYLNSPEFLEQPEFAAFLKSNDHERLEDLRKGMEDTAQLAVEFRELTQKYNLIIRSRDKKKKRKSAIA